MQQQERIRGRAPVRRLLTALLCAAFLAGCRSTALAPERARGALEATLFSPPHNVQTAEFVSGAVTGRPYALAQFLYAKRWLDCTETAPGAFSTAAVCRLNAEGRTYGTANGWTFAPSADPHCEHCSNVAVPVAIARLKSIDGIDAAEKDRAVVAFTYEVVPSEFGAQLEDWMAKHPIAWCGRNPAATGGWNATRAGHAAFVQTKGSWQPAQPAAAFEAAFAPATPITERPCPAGG